MIKKKCGVCRNIPLHLTCYSTRKHVLIKTIVSIYSVLNDFTGFINAAFTD